MNTNPTTIFNKQIIMIARNTNSKTDKKLRN
jgi:hypothetical protein